jgi:methyl-accepting chemotaxis protein
MAENRQAMGNDPLAWLVEDTDVVTDSQSDETLLRKSRSKPVTATQEKSRKSDIDLVEESFAALAEKGELIVKDFYPYLFQHYPELEPLFDGVSTAGQQKKLLTALVLLVKNLRRPEVLQDYLEGLGARHQTYGVGAEDYEKVVASLLVVLRRHGVDNWTDAAEAAWIRVLQSVTTRMLDAYETREGEKMATIPLNNTDDVADVELYGQIDAINKSMGVISFDMDGTIIDANQNFLDAVGYSKSEIVGQHHRIFAGDFANTPEYSAFWTKLNRGEFDAGEYKRLAKGGKEVWLQASYNPILDNNGQPFKVIKFATDITASKLQRADFEGQIEAIDKAMGVISFNLDGTIIDVNDNFLKVVGYSRDEVVGQHHRIFVGGFANTPEYSAFWAKLNRGEFDAGEYKRLAKGGKEVWLQASYNPIFDPSGKPFKVVKYASDITQSKLERADFEGQMEAINKAMGVISFNMDGTIIDINDNFLNVVGYSRDEVIGKHHRMFAEAELASSAGYTEFWAKLNRGEFDSGEYKRIGKGGKEIWLQASYNPIFDPNGKPYKVVKYAADISAQKQLQMTVESVLEATAVVMNAMAEGNLTEFMEGEYEGEFAQLQQAINDTVSKMSSVVQDIVEASISISSAASEISQGNVDLSQRTEEQASSLEETASSMEELTSTVRQNSDNARQANQLAVDAREKAEKGGSVIHNAIQAMAAISASSKKVADIIGVIDEIAFQTNLLALNAAVEAARAGEQGRGFAVVASEVRNLAQRSAAAAKEIKELINDSGEKVREGSDLVNESGKTLEEIVEGAKKVGDIISEIAAAGEEQSSGIEQVNKAVTQMDEMTQQNAALVEEAAAASESLDEQGKSLQQMMAFFNTGTAQTAPAAAPRQARPAPTRPAPQRVKPTARPAPRTGQQDDEWDEF